MQLREVNNIQTAVAQEPINTHYPITLYIPVGVEVASRGRARVSIGFLGRWLAGNMDAAAPEVGVEETRGSLARLT